MDKIIYYLLILYALASCISIAVANVGLCLATVLAIARHLKEPVKVTLDKGLLRGIGIFLLAILISAIFAYKPIVAFERLWINLSRMIPLILASAFIKNREQLIKVLMVMGIFIFIADGYAIWQGVYGNQRAKGFSHAMSLAGYLVQMIPLLLVVGLECKYISLSKRYYLIGVAAVSCVALVYNGTRGAWIAVVVAMLMYSLMQIKYNKKITMVFFVVFICVGLLSANTPLIKNRVCSITDMTNQSNSERILLWNSSWKMFLDYPLVGVGAGNFGEVYKSRYILPEAKEPGLGHAHNNFFQMLAEAGVIGVSAFIYMFGYIIVTMYRRYILNRQETWALVALLVTISFLVQGLTEYNFGNAAVIHMYWFILGTAYSVLQMGSGYSD